MPETQTRPATLTRADRCERCVAAAMVRVTTERLGEWLYCGSCFDRHGKTMPGITRVYDERQPLP